MTNALIPGPIQELLHAFEITQVGLVVHGAPTEQETLAFTLWAAGAGDVVDWVIGDAINYGAAHFEDFLDKLGVAQQTRANKASICRQIPQAERIPGLDFSTHAAAAYLPSDVRAKVLAEAAKSGLTRDEVRDWVREFRGGAKIEVFTARGKVSCVRMEENGTARWTMIVELDAASMSRVDDLPDGPAKVSVAPLLDNEQIYLPEA